MSASAASIPTRFTRALNVLGSHGFEFGSNGHLSVRNPELPGTYYVNPFGVPLASITERDLVLLDDEGAVVESPNGRVVNYFSATHTIHQARPDAEAVTHLHTEYGFAFSALGRPLRAVNTDSTLITGHQALWENFGHSGSAAEAFGPTAKVLIQRGHGFITLGRSIEEASFLLIAAERSAKANLLILAASDSGEVPEIAPEIQERFSVDPETAETHFAIHVAALDRTRTGAEV
jgi:ribulose-5-phosphate 4-epimerase/fuculose-1-phosphate aldolase